jgi:hypothetical protein
MLTQTQQVKPRVNRAQTAVETANVKHSMNPFDELSIEEAIRLRERKVPIQEIVAFSAGPAKSQDVLRTAMAMGADRGIHVVVEDKDPQLEPLGVAKLLSRRAIWSSWASRASMTMRARPARCSLDCWGGRRRRKRARSRSRTGQLPL